MKKVAGFIFLLALVAAGGAWWRHQNLDGLVKSAIEKYGSEMTGAPVRVAAVEIKPVDGRGVIRGLTVGNPAGFKTAHAMKVAEIEVAIDIATLTSNVITVKKIGVKAPNIIYEKGDSMTNFDAIQKSIADYLGTAKKEKDAGGKKLIVEDLGVTGARAEASAAFMGGKTVDVALPDIALRNLGKSKGGVTPGELGQEIAGAVKARLTSAVSFDNLMKSMGGALDKAGGAIKGLFK
jgi:hypothetical protein